MEKSYLERMTFLLRMDDTLIKIGKVFCRDYLQIIYLFLQILCLAAYTRGPIAEDMFEHFIAFILCDDVLKGLVG